MAAAWLAVATVVGVLVGRVVRQRDRQVPREPAPSPAPDIGAGKDDARRGVPGRGRRRS